MTGLRGLVERVVTKQDYFHQPHAAEPDFSDPARSYYYDLRARASYPGNFKGTLPLVDYGGLQFANPIHTAQYGLGHLQRYWDSRENALLEHAAVVAHELTASGRQREAGLIWQYPLEIRGTSNWISAMAQGQVASFLLRVGTLTDSRELLEAAKGALAPFFIDIADGGVRTALLGNLWFEEYAFEPIPFTLNGYIVALLGLFDAASLLRPCGDAYRNLFDMGVKTLEQVLPLFDANGWSRYDLSTKTTVGMTVRNLASPHYHRFHLELLDIMHRLTGHVMYNTIRERWSRPLTEGCSFYTAIAEKTAYRALAGAPFAAGKGRHLANLSSTSIPDQDMQEP